MKFVELKGKSREELKDLALGLKKELFNLRFQKATGELGNLSRFGQVRKDIARIKTAMNMPEGAMEKLADKPAGKKAAKPKAKATMKTTTRTKKKEA